MALDTQIRALAQETGAQLKALAAIVASVWTRIGSDHLVSPAVVPLASRPLMNDLGGGMPATWTTADGDGIAIGPEGVQPNPSALSGGFFVGVPCPASDVEISATITRQVDSSDVGVYLDLYRTAIPSTGSPGAIRVLIKSTYTLLYRLNGGATTGLYTSAVVPAVGDRVALRVVGSTISLVVNGVVLYERSSADVLASIPKGGYAGFARATATVAGPARMKDFVMKVIPPV